MVVEHYICAASASFNGVQESVRVRARPRVQNSERRPCRDRRTAALCSFDFPALSNSASSSLQTRHLQLPLGKRNQVVFASVPRPSVASKKP